MNTVKELFKDVQTSLPRQGLEDEILQTVLLLRSSQIRRRLIVSTAGLIFSGAFIVYAGVVYGSTLLGSEFFSVVSLLFSDIFVVASSWNDFLLLLLETVPVIPILLLLIPTFVFLLFLSTYFTTRESGHYSY